MAMRTPSKRKPCVLLLASIAMAAAVSSAAVAQSDIVEQILAPRYMDRDIVRDACGKIAKLDKKGLEHGPELLAGYAARNAKLLRDAQSNYKFQSAKVDDIGKSLNKHIDQAIAMRGHLTEIANGEEQIRLLDSQIETDLGQVTRAVQDRKDAEDSIEYYQELIASDPVGAISDCIKARLAALNKAPAAPGLAHAAPTALIQSGNAWTCRKDRTEYAAAGKTLPSGSSNDFVIGETTIAMPAYTDPGGARYSAARITFTPPKPRYAVGETVVLELNVEGGKSRVFSQGDANWFAKEIGGGNFMGAVDYGNNRQSRVSFAFQPKAQQGVDVVQGIPFPPPKHPPGVVALILWAVGQGRGVTITWLCGPQ